MIEYPLYYQFGFYAPDSHREPETKIVGILLGAFKDKGFIPTTMQEFEMGTAEQPLLVRPRLQLQFTSPDQDWNLAFEPQRVLFQKMNVPNTDMGTVQDFCREVLDVYQLLLNVIPFNGTRLAYACKGLFPEMLPERLVEVHKRFSRRLPFYELHGAHQWSIRNVAAIKESIIGKEEVLNVITDIGRVQGFFVRKQPPLSFDRIEIGFDINTSQDNMIQRFAFDDISSFLPLVIEKSEAISRDIEEMLNE